VFQKISRLHAAQKSSPSKNDNPRRPARLARGRVCRDGRSNPGTLAAADYKASSCRADGGDQNQKRIGFLDIENQGE